MKKIKRFRLRKKEVGIFTSAERRAWKLPGKMTVSEWAAEHFRLDARTSPEPGRWRNERTPYLIHPLDAFGDPSVERITLIFGPQTGKTESIKIMVGYSVDQDSGPTMIVYPDEKAAKDVSRKRFQSMFRLCPKLRPYVPKDQDLFTVLNYDLINCFIKFAWSGSDMRLASDPIRYLFMDEKGKYRRSPGKQASSAALAEERTKNFPYSRKIVSAGTPEHDDDDLWLGYLDSDQCEYWEPCPHCGTYQLFKREQLTWPEGLKASEIEDQDLAIYSCVECGKRITDTDKINMLALGVWAPRGATVDKAGKLSNAKWSKNRGYRLPSFYSPWVQFSQVAGARVECGEDLPKLQNFINSWLAEPWVVKVAEVKKYALQKRCGGYKLGEMPDEALVLTAGIDAHQLEMYYVIRAWGYQLNNWLVDAGTCTSWEEIKRLVFDTHFRRGNSEQMLGVRLGNADAGWKPEETYEFTRLIGPRARAVRGETRDMGGEFFKVTQIDRDPKTGKKYKNGRILWRIDVGIFKDILAGMINPEEDEAGQWWIPDDVSERYLKQMQSERKELLRTRHGRNYYGWVQKKTDNHYWDCEVYALAAAHMAGVQFLQPEGGTVKSLGIEVQRPAAKKRRRTRGGGSWIGDRGRNWTGR